jgi:transcriptional regulator with XRE-family HTH domain
MSSTQNQVRRKLSRLRKTVPCSQREFARLVGISQSQLSLFELGQVDLDAGTLLAVEHALLKLARVRVGQTLKALLEVV